MSRDAFSYDPRDTRDVSPRSSVRRPRSTPPDTRDARNIPTDNTRRSEAAHAREQISVRDDGNDSPRAYYLRDRAYLLRGSEIHSLTEVGKFRVVTAQDLTNHAYGGDRDMMERDTRRLVREGLLTDKTIPIPQKKTLRVLTLTKAGHRLLKSSNRLPEDQVIYHGLLKAREARHDADLYRLYQKEAARIQRAGGRPLRVVLDYELKRNVNRDVALLGPDKDNPDRKDQIAQKHGLNVVNGKIPVPDLRVEYETAELEVRHLDLELATRDYRPRALADKAAAGFSLYTRSEDSSRLRRILDERELTAEILSL